MTSVSRVEYKPTLEQIEASKARRQAQSAEKHARKNKAGSKTVYDKKTGKYKSVTVTENHVAAKRAEREAAKKLNDSKFGGKTVFDEKTGKYVSKTAEQVKKEALLKNFKPKKSNSLFSGLGKFGKKAAKWGGIGLLIGAGIYAISKLAGNDSKDNEPVAANQDNIEQENPTTTTPEQNNNDETNPVITTPEEDNNDKTDPVITTPGEDNNDETNPTKPGEPSPLPEKPDPDNANPAQNNNEYTVVKGDNVWNIAKQHLKDLNNDPNYKPTNAEILKHTKELMELNQLEFEADGYHVMIKPNEKLKLTA